ncbi:response regulator [Desulfobacterales bacterium HSG2]|nr:response regulator [Desulfobacterales bacterium HSG2]
MTNDKDNVTEKLQKRIRQLEAALGIVADHSGKTENRMRKQFEVVSETIPVPMIISDENGKIVFANLNAQKTFGYSPEDFTGVEASSLYDNPEKWKLFLETLANREEVSGFRVELRKSEGPVFPAALFSREIYFDGQDCVLTIVHDLTEVMALEKQLRQTQKMEAVGTLTSGIAHDFNNILTVIFGYAQLTDSLLDSDKDREKKEYLDYVVKAAIRAKSMIRQMMDFCRKTEKKKKLFHISAIVGEVVKMMSDLTRSDIDIRSDTRDKDMFVKGEPTQIHQMVTNLITNSVHALSDKGGKIEVILEKADITEKQRGEILIPKPEPGIYARITVRDNGPGIGKGIIHSIFDPFFTTKPVGQGSGMGLAVVHGIIRGHSGYVSVESGLGEGAAFHCYFPVTEEDDENAEPDAETERVGKGDESILLADDEPMVLGACSKFLRIMGYSVTSCSESMKALKIFKNHPEAFDLVITDNIMPEMSGTELSKEIRKIRPDIPIILITGSLFKRESDLKKAGIRAFIQKPFDQRKMGSVIREVLDDGKKV